MLLIKSLYSKSANRFLGLAKTNRETFFSLVVWLYSYNNKYSRLTGSVLVAAGVTGTALRPPDPPKVAKKSLDVAGAPLIAAIELGLVAAGVGVSMIGSAANPSPAANCNLVKLPSFKVPRGIFCRHTWTC